MTTRIYLNLSDTKHLIFPPASGSIVIIIDGWTDDHVHRSYLGLVALLAYEEAASGAIVRRKFTLHVNEMEEMVKSKEVITNHFYSVLSQYGLSRDEIKEKVFVVDDRGGNIRYAIFDEGIAQILCYCHLINNLVGKMLSLEEVKKHITAASELVNYVKNGGLCTKLDSTLKTYCKTRWNSVFLMFDSIIRNYAQILSVLGDKQAAQSQNNSNRSSAQRKSPLDYVCDFELPAIRAIADFLQHFRNMTVTLEGHQKPTLHLVWPVHLKIWNLLGPDIAELDADYGHLIEDMKSDGLTYFRSNFIDFQPKKEHKIATILHPLLKNLNTVPNTDKTNAYRMLDIMMREMQPEEINNNRRPASNNFDLDFLNDFVNGIEVIILFEIIIKYFYLQLQTIILIELKMNDAHRQCTVHFHSNYNYI